ncbi:hypothetical protein L249_4796 [Ophiocordyceps polyrhachis-furcata BCC 54312]|uniref:Uncharacterized protein n=1 Tax=Ophiocordyceps polyrhachis-furcata BCC 54312 TaxID=1330021 RepID=A0A367L2L1_9HYPO|nr:hypothetical protein L249_4796 [Ophiocordyceps polyrhachis-furcata BCC 54312]
MPPRIQVRDVETPLPPGTIVGIVIGVVLIFALAALLFIIYYRREASMDELDDSSVATTTGECRERGVMRGDSQLFGSSGDYYDLVNRHVVVQAPLNPDNAMPTHPAYIPTSSWPVIRPPPEPPSSVPVRSNRPDSYAVQAYLAAAQESARMAPPPAAVRTGTERRTSRSFALPLASLPRIAVPRKQTRAETEPHERLRHHSPPVTEWRSSSRQRNHHDDDNFFEVPLRSGKSTLYGY